MQKEIYINEDIIKYLEKRQLIKQYEKVEKFLKKWNFRQVDLRLREPKKDKIYYFKINKQFRLWCKMEWNKIFVFEIDNHQN